MRHEITAYLHAETDAAILVGESPEQDRKADVWLPKSQIDWSVTGSEHGTRVVTVEAPEWLLIDKGLEHLV